jgi:SAM-dependent methyltransferase
MTQPYTTEFFASHHAGALRSARVVVPLVMELVAPRSVVDVGCGDGTWLSVFYEHGITDVYGVDGEYVDRASLEIPRERFHSHDLCRPLPLSRRFDLAMSLEVAEHLPAEAADEFVASLVRLAPIVLFSAAAPYQGGEHHVNEQWPAYWSERFAHYNFLPVDCLRRRIWANPDVEWWYAQNVFLYVERQRLETDLILKRHYETAGPVPLALVHPRRFVEWVEWGLHLCGAEPSAAARNGVVS